MFSTFKKFCKEHYLAILIFVFSITGFIAAFTLSVDKLNIIRNPNQTLACNVNAYFSCGIVMKSSYSEIFGIPWSFLGVAGYPATMLMGLLLIERKKLSKWLSWLLTLPAFGAFALSTWFMYVSAYLIGVFCPWCILSAISSTVIFFSLVTHNLLQNNYQLPESKAEFFQRKIAAGWNVIFTVLWFIALVIVEYIPFWTGK